MSRRFYCRAVDPFRGPFGDYVDASSREAAQAVFRGGGQMITPDAIHYITWTWEAFCALGPAAALALIAWRIGT
jgi:hypothetical protein